MPTARYSIFRRERLRPSQLRTVADRRWGDADSLRQTGRNERANGAMYLGGFVIELLLKARLLELHPWLQTARESRGLSPAQKRIWSLCYRSHDLDEILAFAPDIIRRLQACEIQGRPRLREFLSSVCAEWTIFACYSPRTATMAEACEFLDRIEELRPWLRK